tara:strand:+ start:4252 stop:4983 length:732 start_codon:yes stop_codon:yes gene_type:complete
MLQDYDDSLQRFAIGIFDREGAATMNGLQAVRAGRTTVLEHQVQVYRRLDAALSTAEDPPGHTLACRSGCSYCCHYHVYVTVPEALAIAEHLRTLPVPKRDVFLQRLRSNAARASELGKEAHIQTNVACAFLSTEGACDIYALRPSACRRHHSYDVTPCRTTYEDPSCADQNPMSPARHATTDAFHAAAATVAAQKGFDIARYEMSGAVLEAATNTASAKRWKAGKTAFPSVRDRDESGGLQA